MLYSTSPRISSLRRAYKKQKNKKKTVKASLEVLEQQIPQPITFSEYLPKEWFKQADSEEEPEILSCNTITVNIDFESARANVTQSPLYSEKAMIQAARIDNQHAQVTIALRGINVPADLFVPEKNLLRHPYPAWVDRVPFPQGY